MNLNNIGIVIRESRKKNNLSLEVLSGFIGIDTSHLAKIERGEFIPLIDTFCKIAEALDMKPSELMAKVEKKSI